MGSFRNVRLIFGREILATFQNPAVYVVAGLFFFLVSSIVLQSLTEYARESTSQDLFKRPEAGFTQSVVTTSFGVVSILFVFVAPILTMRAFSEEKRSGMFELMASWPVRDWEWILGKYLSLLSVLLLIEAIMTVYVIVFFILGSPDPGVILSCYLGVGLISAAYVSLGLFASSLTENQMIAAVISFVGLFFFWIIQNLAGDSGGQLSRLCEALSVSIRFSNFAKGAVSLYDALYFILFAAFWLFLTARSLELHRERI